MLESVKICSSPNVIHVETYDRDMPFLASSIVGKDESLIGRTFMFTMEIFILIFRQFSSSDS